MASWQSTNVDGGNMRVHVTVPEGIGPFSGIVIIHHQGGVDDSIQGIAQRLSSAGYVAAAPDLYHRDGPDCKDDAKTRRERLRDSSVIRDVNAAVDLLKAHPSVDGHRLGIIGFCMGGRVAYLMAATHPSLRASVVYYGGSIMNAWGGDGPTPFQRSADIHCPILGHFGEDDKNPSPEDMRKYDAELNKYSKVHEFFSYPGAGHAFMSKNEKSYRPDADAASWPRTLDFFARHLGRDTVRVPARSR